VEGLDCQQHAGGTRVLEDRGEPVLDHLARGSDVPGAWAQAADHQDQTHGVERRRLVDGPAIVIDRSLPCRRIGSGKHAAAAKPAHGHAVVLDDARRFGEGDPRHLVAPRRHRPDAGSRATLNRLAQIPLLAHGGEVDG
jgi:hypothetical protein